MAFLGRFLKVDLKCLAEELGEIVTEDMKVPALKKVIVASKKYEDVFVKELLERIVSEREEIKRQEREKEKEIKRQEEEIRRQEREDEIKRQEREYEIKRQEREDEIKRQEREYEIKCQEIKYELEMLKIEASMKCRRLYERIRVEGHETERRRAEEETRRRVEEETRRRVEEEASRRVEEEASGRVEEEARLKAEEETARLRAEEAARFRVEEMAKLKAEEVRLRADDGARRKADEEKHKAEDEENRKAAERRMEVEQEMRLEQEKWLVEEQMHCAQEDHRMLGKAEEQMRMKAEDQMRMKAKEQMRMKAVEQRQLLYKERRRKAAAKESEKQKRVEEQMNLLEEELQRKTTLGKEERQNSVEEQMSFLEEEFQRKTVAEKDERQKRPEEQRQFLIDDEPKLFEENIKLPQAIGKVLVLKNERALVIRIYPDADVQLAPTPEDKGQSQKSASVVIIPVDEDDAHNEDDSVAENKEFKSKRRKKKWKKNQNSKMEGNNDAFMGKNNAENKDINVEYVQEIIDVYDPLYSQFMKIFERFKLTDAEKEKEESALDVVRDQIKEENINPMSLRKIPVDLDDEELEENDDEGVESGSDFSDDENDVSSGKNSKGDKKKVIFAADENNSDQDFSDGTNKFARKKIKTEAIFDDERNGVKIGEAKWKEKLVKRATDDFYEKQKQTVDLQRLVYEARLTAQGSNEHDPENEIGGLFHLDKHAKERRNLRSDNAMDCSALGATVQRNCTDEKELQMIKDWFVTVKWKNNENAEHLLNEDDDELYGDFEDLETGTVHKGKETVSKEDEEESDEDRENSEHDEAPETEDAKEQKDKALQKKRMEKRLKDEVAHKVKEESGLKIDTQPGINFKEDVEDGKGMEIPIVVTEEEKKEAKTVTVAKEEKDAMIETEDHQTIRSQVKSQNPSSIDLLNMRIKVDAMRGEYVFQNEGHVKDEEVTQSNIVEVILRLTEESREKFEECTTQGKQGIINMQEVSLSYSGVEYRANKESTERTDIETKDLEKVLTERKKGDKGVLNVGEIAATYSRVEYITNKDVKQLSDIPSVEHIDIEEVLTGETLKPKEVAAPHSETKCRAGKDAKVLTDNLNIEHKDMEVITEFMKGDEAIVPVVAPHSGIEYRTRKYSKEQSDALNVKPNDIGKALTEEKKGTLSFEEFSGTESRDFKELTDTVHDEHEETEVMTDENKQQEVEPPHKGTELSQSREQIYVLKVESKVLDKIMTEDEEEKLVDSNKGVEIPKFKDAEEKTEIAKIESKELHTCQSKSRQAMMPNETLKT